MVLPAQLVGPVAEAKRLRDGGTAVLPQLTLAHLLESGGYDRHLRRMRRSYRARRDALLEALGAHLPAARVTGIAPGLHALVTLPYAVDTRALEDAARRRRLALASIDIFQLAPARNARQLVVGYGNLDAAAAAPAVRALAAAVEACGPSAATDATVGCS
jgi:GntR family transcriptional regulator/MocR family aminotransferase